MRRSRADTRDRQPRAVRAAVATIGLVISALAFPDEATAQHERFARALMGLHSALDGRYGDEGAEVSRWLDDVSAGLADWDRGIRDAEISRRADLGQLYLKRGRLTDALKAFEAANQGALRALTLEALGRSDAAAAAYRQAWSLDPDDPTTAYLALTRSQIEGRDVARITDTLLATYRGVIRGERERPSAPFFDRAVLADNIEGTPVFPLARYADGFALIARGEHEKGIARLREAAANDPLLADPALRTEPMKLATVALRQGRLAQARTALETVVQANPRSSEAHRLLATACVLAGDTARSAAHLENALRLRPDDERSWIALARLRADSGMLAEAASTLEAAIKAVPESGELRWRLAGLLVRLEKNGDALVRYEEAVQRPAISGQEKVHQSVATLASVLRDVQGVAEAIERRVRLTPNDAAAHRDLASVYTKQGRQEEAFAELVIAAWLNPEDPLTLVALGHSHMTYRRDQDAVEALQRAVAIQPGLQEARYALSQALTRVGKREEARPHLAEFQRLRAESAERDRRELEIAVLKAEASRQSLSAQHLLAAQTWMKVVALEPASSQNYLALADALVKAGRVEESLQHLVKAADLDGVAEVHRRIADVLARLGRTRESRLAQETYERLRLEDFQRRSGR